MDIIEEIKEKDALKILESLIKNNPKIQKKVEEIFLKELKKIEYESIASDIYFDLELLDVHDLWNNSGKSQYEYIDPHEYAFNMIEEVICPYMEELQRYLNMSMFDESTLYCIGIIMGLCKFDKDSDSEFKEWSEDTANEIAFDVFLLWKEYDQNNQNKNLIKKILKKEYPKWFDEFNT